jgi:uncharacterized membrane protein YeaQ/YmgE (transglycosylase-associated protein family)
MLTHGDFPVHRGIKPLPAPTVWVWPVAAQGTAAGLPSGMRRPMVGFLLSLIAIGLIAGLIARALVPGRQSMGCLPTIGLGIVGSFVGGFLGWLIFDRETDTGAFEPAGLLGSIAGAVIALLVLNAMGRRRGSRRRRRRRL